MLYEVIKAALLIFLAEMGDKTQILAMAFALQFAVRQVLTGVAFGSFLNHGLAVLIGAYLAHRIPLGTIRLCSAFLFLGFGLWSLREEEEKGEEASKRLNNPILVVALAFFLGELGDKTQLTALSLASSSQYPWSILAGTVLGMVLTSYVGIFVGLKLGERIPEFTLKLVSSGVFIGFGIFHLVQTVPTRFLTPFNSILFLTVLLTLILYLILPPLRQKRLTQARPGQLKRVASTLQALDQALDNLCLGEEPCRADNCPVGYCKELVRQELAGVSRARRLKLTQPYVKRKQSFDGKKVQEVLRLVENSGLDPAMTRELKTNLEKLLPHP